MRLLMLSGDRQTSAGNEGPFFAMQREFSRHFQRIDVLCPRPDGPVVLQTMFGNVHLHPAPCGRLGMLSYLARRGRELLERFSHDLIASHDYGWFYNGFCAAALSESTGVPYVSEIHHVPGVPQAASAGERCSRIAAEIYLRWARDRAAAFRVVNREEMPEYLRRLGVPAEKILVLPSLYIDLAVFRPAAEAVAPEQDVVFVGRMVENKGVDRIVDALALCAVRRRELSALLVGRGPMLAAVRRRVLERGLERSVKFLEWVQSAEELAHVYRRSRAVVCASTCEGGPRFTVEAMACGTPVVSTPVGMMRELVEEGRNGAIAGFDAASLSKALERVLGDEERRKIMGEHARADVQRFEYSAGVARYARGLIALAENGRACAG